MWHSFVSPSFPIYREELIVSVLIGLTTLIPITNKFDIRIYIVNSRSISEPFIKTVGTG
jgi:hypothetical protein